MSHFTRVKTVIRDHVLLQDTLRQLHYRFQAGEQVTIRGYQGNTEHGQVVVDTGSQYDIGFQRQADESFAVCADWWGVRTNSALKEESFLQQVNQTYAHLAMLGVALIATNRHLLAGLESVVQLAQRVLQ